MARTDAAGRQQRAGGPVMGQRNSGGGNESRFPSEQIREALDQEGEKLVELAEKVAEKLVGGEVTKTQLRKVFGEVRKIHFRFISEYKAEEQHSNEQILKETRNRLAMLKPRLVYAAAKSDNKLKELSDVVINCVTIINNCDDQNFKRYFLAFVNFFEAVLAFHRARG